MRQRDRFAAIARLNGGDLTMVPNLVALNETAIARNKTYNFIAPFEPFDPTHDTPAAQKRRFEAAQRRP